jgi:hypothetical protein
VRAPSGYVQAIYGRYRHARRPDKQRILDEFCAVTGYHRKAAIRVLNGPDIHTTWVETAAGLGRSQAAVQAALEDLRQALPFRLCGIDSDNGPEFINQHLWDCCQAREIQLTRGRPYKKDDNAHIEQKNWTHVRKLLGYAAELRRQRDHLDPFVLARTIEQKLERIYALANARHSPGAASSSGPTLPVRRRAGKRLSINPNPRGSWSPGRPVTSPTAR